MVAAMMVFMHWMQPQWPHGITTVSRGLVQQTGQFVDDAATVVDTLVAVADCVLLVDAADLAIDERSTVRTVGTTIIFL